MDDSVKLAKQWSELHGLKEQIDNQIIPVMGYLGIEDPELIFALETVSAKIEDHFKKFRLFTKIRVT